MGNYREMFPVMASVWISVAACRMLGTAAQYIWGTTVGTAALLVVQR